MNPTVAKLIFFTVPIFLLISCAVRKPVETDPLRSDLFEKVRLIMFEEEEAAYRNLPDTESKTRFLEEFWRRRDPDPLTEENEFKLEFAERIEEANELFGFGFGRGGLNTGRGWNSDQGRIYLVLGPPDRIRRFSREVEPAMRSGADDPRRGQIPEAVQIEEWFYEKHSSSIEFERDKRSWHLGAQSPVVLSVIQRAKEDLVSPEYASSLLQSLRAEAFYKDGEIVVEIPADRLYYKEEGELLKASVRIYVEVIFEGERLEEFTRIRDFELTETELLAQSSFVLQIPYITAEKGSYIFEIVIEDVMSMTPSKFRSLVKYKY